MKYETNEYIIFYNDCDKEYIDDLIKYFETEKEKIFEFFDIKKLKKKLIVNLYDTIEKYAEYRKYHLSETSVGNFDADNNNYYIHMLSYKELLKRKGYNEKKLIDFYKLLVHEFVHVCHDNIAPIMSSLIWIREGIAILLSHQYDNFEIKLVDCKLEQLLNNDNKVYYNNYYSLIKSALINNGIDYVKKLVLDSEFGKEETSKIYNELISK